MAREASGLGLSDLKSVEFSLILTDGPASTNEWKRRGQILSKMSHISTTV